MALILKFKSFILVLQIWKIKKIKRKIYCVFHVISVVTITLGLPAVILNGDG